MLKMHYKELINSIKKNPKKSIRTIVTANKDTCCFTRNVLFERVFSYFVRSKKASYIPQYSNKYQGEQLRTILVGILLSASISNFCYATRSLPISKPIPGGIAVLPLDIHTLNLPVVFFNNKRVLVVKYQNPTEKNLTWIAIVGIPITTKPGVQKISIHADKIDHNHFHINIEKSFLVQSKTYPTEALKINRDLVEPVSATDRIRAAKELESIKTAYNYWSQQIPNLKLLQPTEGRKASAFGLKRILNGKNRGYHSGIDLAAPIGTTIYAPASGQVILTGNFFYTGNTIFIDHGQGLITSYFHLNTIKVAEGDFVETKAVIGTVGATGRTTGPHLHWSVSLNDARINPELFLE